MLLDSSLLPRPRVTERGDNRDGDIRDSIGTC